MREKQAGVGSREKARQYTRILKKYYYYYYFIILFARDDEVAAMREDELRILTEKKNEGYIRPHKLRIKKIDR